MSDYLAVCGECQHRQKNGYCPVQGSVRREYQILCDHFKAVKKSN